MNHLNFHHLRYFWAVAHEGNLTRAAQRLHVSQSAVSVQIKQLEQQLGHELFERRGRQLALTEAGSIALDYADTVFGLGDELVGTLGEHTGTARRVLRVGALSTLSRNFQISFLQPLLGRDEVELVLRSGALNVPGIVGFGRAAELAHLEGPGDAGRMAGLRDRLERGLIEIGGVTVNGAGAPRLPNTSSLAFEGVDAESLLRRLESVEASTSAACR